MQVEHLFYIYLIHIEVYPDDKGVEICKFIQYLKFNASVLNFD